MEYLLKYDSDGALRLFRDGVPVPATDILGIYPDRRVWCFDGPMGAGKTTFTTLLCESMGSPDVVNSPTFAIVNVYEDAAGEEIYHFDCYRLKSLAEALDLGAEEYIWSGHYCFIEWSENIADLLPDDAVHVRFSVLSPDTRRLEL